LTKKIKIGKTNYQNIDAWRESQKKIAILLRKKDTIAKNNDQRIDANLLPEFWLLTISGGLG
jgi:hypothetical protein